MWYYSDTREVLYPNDLFYSGKRPRVFLAASDLPGDIIEAGGDSPCLCEPSFIVLTSAYEAYLYFCVDSYLDLDLYISSFCVFKSGYDEPPGATVVNLFDGDGASSNLI